MFKQKRYHYFKDNMLRKFKFMFTKSLFNFINQKLDNKIHLRKLNYNFIKKVDSKHNNEILLKTLGDYFSNDVSSKCFNVEKDYNRKLIYKLIHEDKVFENIFNKTILECLEHIRGTKKINGLEGLENEYSKMIEKLQQNEEDEEYILDFINIIYTLDKR